MKLTYTNIIYTVKFYSGLLAAWDDSKVKSSTQEQALMTSPMFINF